MFQLQTLDVMTVEAKHRSVFWNVLISTIFLNVCLCNRMLSFSEMDLAGGLFITTATEMTRHCLLNPV